MGGKDGGWVGRMEVECERWKFGRKGGDWVGEMEVG